MAMILSTEGLEKRSGSEHNLPYQCLSENVYDILNPNTFN